MKKAIFIVILVIILLSLSSLAFASDFCEGYQDGYAVGYCYHQFACIKPISPICPIPNIGENTYQDGYNRGFLAGLNARR
jgi:hypothetical protein